MQTKRSNTKDKSKQKLSFPYGLGSMAWHGAVWWLIYTNRAGKRCWVNSYTDDPALAKRRLAVLALDRLYMQVEMLEGIVNETPDPADPGNSTIRPGRENIRPRSARGKAVRDSGEGAGAEAGAGGQE